MEAGSWRQSSSILCLHESHEWQTMLQSQPEALAELTPAQRSMVGLVWETARLAVKIVPLTIVSAQRQAEKGLCKRQMERSEEK